MSNSFPSASTVLRRLTADVGIDALPAHKYSSRDGYYVVNGLVHVSGPTIQAKGSDPSWMASELATILDRAGWNVSVERQILVRVTSIPKAARR